MGGNMALMKQASRPIQLIVAADEPALLFSSVKAAEGYLEAVDVRNGVYTAAYGPAGEPFSITAVGDHVVIRQSTDEPLPNQLVQLLQKLLPSEERSDDLAVLLGHLSSHVSA